MTNFVVQTRHTQKYYVHGVKNIMVLEGVVYFYDSNELIILMISQDEFESAFKYEENYGREMIENVVNVNKEEL